MGGAILRCAIGRVVSDAQIIDPASVSEEIRAHSGVSWHASLDELNPSFEPDIVLIAIKPQYIAEILPAYARFKKSVFLSIAAGQTITRISALLGSDSYSIVRSMPNLPASIGGGATVAVANKNVSAAQHEMCDRLLHAVGFVAWVEDENLIDAVTALSGSGPAYVFALVEAMTKAGEKLGLPTDMAMQLARQTIIGSAALLAQSDESAEALRKAVTSPGGTTEAALKILLGPQGLNELVDKAMKAAEQRAKELSK